MFKIQLLMFSRLQDFNSITEYYRVLQSITDNYRVLQSITEHYRVLQSITKYYKDKSRASTWTNFWACYLHCSDNADKFWCPFLFEVLLAFGISYKF